jgi:hypothetical protein
MENGLGGITATVTIISDMMTDSGLNIPAFVLGNGPRLPGLGALAPLQQRFTVGVNRILRSGFVIPQARFIIDGFLKAMLQELG